MTDEKEEKQEEDKGKWTTQQWDDYYRDTREHAKIQESHCPLDRRDWTVKQWTDYAKAGNKDLRGAELEFAYLEGIDLRDADLTGAFLGEAMLERADLRGAILDDAYLGGASLRGANLEGHDLDDLRKRVAGF